MVSVLVSALGSGQGRVGVWSGAVGCCKVALGPLVGVFMCFVSGGCHLRQQSFVDEVEGGPPVNCGWGFGVRDDVHGDGLPHTLVTSECGETQVFEVLVDHVQDVLPGVGVV